MTAVLDAPAASEPVVPAVRRRGRARLVLAAVLVLGGLLWSAVLWAPSAVDLTAGQTRSVGAAEVVTVPGYGARGTDVVDYRHGAGVELVVPLRNDGPLPVRVTSASAGDVPRALLSLSGAQLPVTVGPGESADLVLTGELGNCAYYHERAVQNVDGVDLRLEVLGREVDRTLALDRPLLVHSPMIVGCPDRTLTRNDDQRTPDADAV